MNFFEIVKEGFYLATSKPAEFNYKSVRLDDECYTLYAIEYITGYHYCKNIAAPTDEAISKVLEDIAEGLNIG